MAERIRKGEIVTWSFHYKLCQRSTYGALGRFYWHFRCHDFSVHRIIRWPQHRCLWCWIFQKICFYDGLLHGLLLMSFYWGDKNIFLFHHSTFFSKQQIRVRWENESLAYSHLTFTGFVRWPWRDSEVWTLSSQCQTAFTPWIRHLSTELINPERGRMASACMLHGRHWQEGILGENFKGTGFVCAWQ